LLRRELCDAKLFVDIRLELLEALGLRELREAADVRFLLRGVGALPVRSFGLEGALAL